MLNVLKCGQLSPVNSESISNLLIELLKPLSNKCCENQDESSTSRKDGSNE